MTIRCYNIQYTEETMAEAIEEQCLLPTEIVVNLDCNIPEDGQYVLPETINGELPYPCKSWEEEVI